MAFSLPRPLPYTASLESHQRPQWLKAPAQQALRKVLEVLLSSRQRDPDCEVARFIRRNGGQLTDEIEREISRRFGSPVLRTLLATALGLGLLAPLSGHAGELKPVQGQSFDLGSMRGVAYYTVEPDGYRVVATFAGENVSPVRVSAILRAGQSATLSVPGGLGESGTSLRIDRAGDRVTVSPTRAPGPGH